MGTPSSYPLTSENLKTLSGLSSGFTSENLKARSDVPATSFTSANLLGLTDSNPPIWTAGTSASKQVASGSVITYVYLNAIGTIDLQNGTDGSWLPSGAAAGNYRAKWVKVSGSTPSNSSGWASNTYLALSATRSLQLGTSDGGFVTCQVDFTLQETASLASVTKRVTITAESLGGGGCPLCCFTPDTLVLMASGLSLPIGSIRTGDVIQTVRGPEAVRGVITRTQRKMFRVKIEDGSTLNVSEDHPLFIVGKGYASINPPSTYKDLGKPQQLEVGDCVLTSTCVDLKIVAIEKIDYPGEVYTLDNTEFFAGGVLVY